MRGLQTFLKYAIIVVEVQERSMDMKPKTDNHDTFFPLDFQEMAWNFFALAMWFGNVFVNPRDIWRGPEVQT